MTYEQLPDEALFEAYRQGELRAFEHLLQRHRQPVYNFMCLQIGSGAAADGLLHEVFLRVLEEARSKRQRASFKTLLYVIARDLCLRKSNQETSLVERGDRPQKGVAERIRNAVEELDIEEREVFLFREYLDLSFAQIAEIVGCDRNTVKDRMRKALERLRREVA
jgi:RNA polymerase sigma-70 factor (ECF subfamily)